jgi:hypothetical protein
MDNGEKTLVTALASVGNRLAGYVRGAADEDVTLGRDLTILGHMLQRQTKLRAARWGHTDRAPGRGHVRATDADAGPALCGAWLVGDLAGTDFVACPACLTVLARKVSR